MYKLSKSRCVLGEQRRKLLWLYVHKPDAPELQTDSTQQKIATAGTAVGDENFDEKIKAVYNRFRKRPVEQMIDVLQRFRKDLKHVKELHPHEKQLVQSL